MNYLNKNLLSVISISLMLLLVGACNKEETKTISSKDKYFISASELKEMGPVAFLKRLKNNCCKPVVIENISTKDWISKDDIKELKEYLKSTDKASAVVSIHSSHRCSGDKYVSTTAYEAKHLIEASREGKYPLSMCSTYDSIN